MVDGCRYYEGKAKRCRHTMMCVTPTLAGMDGPSDLAACRVGDQHLIAAV